MDDKLVTYKKNFFIRNKINHNCILQQSYKICNYSINEYISHFKYTKIQTRLPNLQFTTSDQQLVGDLYLRYRSLVSSVQGSLRRFVVVRGPRP